MKAVCHNKLVAVLKGSIETGTDHRVRGGVRYGWSSIGYRDFYQQGFISACRQRKDGGRRKEKGRGVCLVFQNKAQMVVFWELRAN